MARISKKDVDAMVRELYSLTTTHTNNFLSICNDKRLRTDSVDAEIYFNFVTAEALWLSVIGLNLFAIPATKQPNRSYVYNVTRGEWYDTKIKAAYKCNVRRQRVHACLTNGGVIDNDGRPILLGYLNLADRTLRIPFNTQVHLAIPIDDNFLIEAITGLASANQVAQKLGELFTRENDDEIDRRLRNLLQY